MKLIKGTVKNNVIVIDSNLQLPEGSEVEIILPTHRQRLDSAVERLLANQIRRPVGIDEIIEEDKREREGEEDEGR